MILYIHRRERSLWVGICWQGEGRSWWRFGKFRWLQNVQKGQTKHQERLFLKGQIMMFPQEPEKILGGTWVIPQNGCALLTFNG